MSFFPQDAEKMGYNPEDVSVALSLSNDKGAIEWLKENWNHMIETVSTLASNQLKDKMESDVGEITYAEAKQALRSNKGNIWESVKICVEKRKKNVRFATCEK